MPDFASHPTRQDRAAVCVWMAPAYGVPTATSEVSRVAGFYSVAALTVFAGDAIVAKRDRPDMSMAA
jgi:hypothetical protein